MKGQMKAALYEEFGELQIDTIDIPEVKEGEVLIRIKAAGVNPVDAAVNKGMLKDAIPHEFPIIPGWDLSGIVEENGKSASQFEAGDEVYAYARLPVVQQGTFAEYTAIPEKYLAKKPVNISHQEAGGIPLVGLTAYQCLYEEGNLQEEETVLILGASGGVGSMGIQLAKAKGAEVIGVASEDNFDYMKGLGADECIDYHDTDIGVAVKTIQAEGVDLIFDCANGETLHQSLAALKEDGKLVSILNRGEGISDDIDHEYVFVEPNAKQLDHLREMVESGKITVHVSKTYPLEETEKALEQIQSLHTTGKMVIVP